MKTTDTECVENLTQSFRKEQSAILEDKLCWRVGKVMYLFKKLGEFLEITLYFCLARF